MVELFLCFHCIHIKIAAMQTILKYFPDLTDTQIKAFEQLAPLYQDWNNKINVISRKDIDNLYERHVLHSLAIAKYISFNPKANVLDLGTGGGFPGIPLAILFPEVHFTLIDGTLKKIKVVKAVAEVLDLKNVTALQMRAEEFKKRFDFIITRAVASMEKLLPWSQRLISNQQFHGIPNGLIALKGGDIDTELKAMPKGHYYEVIPLSDFFDIEFFESKSLVYLQG